MSEKTRINNDQEDELNQSRFFAERGAEVVETEEPGAEGPEIEEEDIMDSKSRFREQPAVQEPSNAADKSHLFGQGFASGNDAGIRREPEPAKQEERGSLSQ